ncbi:MAG: hypothetical protein RMK89_14430 [Armatimonadota bacterium]|nr:hypothetical protein [Armatimonadota bacterium]MDW8144642.1 hypothetical protein [Armatimonadota bacterium]
MRQELNPPDWLPEPTFQSHCGAIATELNIHIGDIVLLFQSHCGAIATRERRMGEAMGTLRFNPTVVRLRRIP